MASVIARPDLHPSADRRWTFAGSVVGTQLRVWYAVMMHDIKSRFFGNGLGYIVTILWASVHIAVIVGVFYFTDHRAPYGDSTLLYATISVLPFIMWNYISRFTMMGIAQNRSFLQYPLVKPLDLMIGREALELVSCTIITICLVFFLLECGLDPMPHRPTEAAFALGSAALLGIGFGILGGVVVMIVPFFHIIYVCILIVAWVTSGLTINAEVLPTQLADLLAWNPILHSVEWMRYAYYDDFPARLLDRRYVLAVGAGALTIGLTAERALRHIALSR